MATVNDHGQPQNSAFNYQRNVEKAFLTLRGILQGVVADKQLNETEVLFLDTWLKNERHAKMEGDMLDVCDLLTDILEDGVVTHDELNDLKNLVSDVLEFGHNDESTYEAQLNQMLGYLQGITADNVLTEKEITAFQQWLKSHEAVLSTWPGDVLIQRINEILADGIITEEEKADLLETIKQITGQRFLETGIAHGMATEFCTQPLEIFTIRDANICFTGKFVSGTRTEVEKMAKAQGAAISKSITKKLDLLVIGTIASRDWKFSSLGRKIEAAIKLQNEGSQLKIVTEKNWLKLVEL